MFVDVTGRGPNGPATRSWHLLAEGDHGPLIPAMALEALVRRVLAGTPPPPGARAAMRDLELEDYETLFASRDIFTGTREVNGPDIPLYERLLGSTFATLPAPVQAMHRPDGEMVVEGRARVERGTNPLTNLVAWVFGFPKASEDVPVRVTFREREGSEVWERDFAGHRFHSTQTTGDGPCVHLLAERFGPFVFGLALVVDGDRLRLIPRRWTAFGLPMPRFLMPGGESYETAKDDHFHFHVEIRLPVLGLMVRYRGWLVPVNRP